MSHHLSQVNEDCRYGITVIHEPSSASSHLAKPVKVAFDLVAIHGLNGDAFRTWTHQQSQVMWLRDLLPEALPNIRIMTYGYNASFHNFTGHQDLRNIATKLLTELSDLRVTGNELHRPIVFVCHSLGGIVAKKALLVRVPNEQSNVQSAVYGVMFLGTPHNGSNLATCGKMIANIVTACSPLNPAKTLLGVLQKDSEALFEITEDFREKAKELHLVSFFEMEMTNFGVFRRFVVEQNSAILNLHNEVTIGQYADHRNIARFRSIHDRNFRPVLTRLHIFRTEIEVRNENSTQESISENSPAFFEVPSVPCDTFRGREDILAAMERYFQPLEKTAGQLSFAICGLGGVGKTQTALQYTMQTRHKYSSGVFFFNADSVTALSADFDRISHLVGLESSSIKTDAVKRWLSRKENQNWLLIFDNVDDLEAVRITKYFPTVSWGHIILTTRDQAAIGSVAKQGFLLERLSVEDAVGVLLEKAGIKKPKDSDYQEAAVVVQLLGCLPLAVDQGGAFIKSRQKTLTDYRRLFGERQAELLKYKPRLVEYDKTVFTAWEINFKQAERDSKVASEFLLLLCFLDNVEIPEKMLLRGCSPQPRWATNGESIYVSAEDEGVDSSLVALIKNEFAFDEIIDKLLSFSLINTHIDNNGSRKFSLHPLVQYCASQRSTPEIQEKWRLQAICLVCHAFPRNKFLEPLNGELGNMQLSNLNRVLKEYDLVAQNVPASSPVRLHLAAALLSASRFSIPSWKLHAVNRAKELLESNSDCFLRAWAAYRESSLFRMLGDEKRSNETLEKFIHSTALPNYAVELESSARYNAQRGELVVSYAKNLIQDGEFALARKELCEWLPLDPSSPSAMERMSLRARDITIGKSIRHEGYFEEALTYLQCHLKDCDDKFYEGTGWRRVQLTNVADLYTELERPELAESLLTPELSEMMSKGQQNISSGRHLQLSLIESFMKRRSYDRAKEYLTNLKKIYEDIKEHDALTRSGLFRVWTSLARISHIEARWDEALMNWRKALENLRSGGENSKQSAGVIRYGMAYALYKLGRIDESLRMAKQGRLDLKNQRRIFWIVGFNSYWQDYIVNCVEATAEMVTNFEKY